LPLRRLRRLAVPTALTNEVPPCHPARGVADALAPCGQERSRRI
jgi:hypothetical protein